MTEPYDRILVLARHGKSEPHVDASTDHARALKRRGEAESLLLGRWLVDHGLAPDRVLASDSKRTWQTYQHLLGALEQPCESSFLPSLYLAPALDIAEEVGAHGGDAQTLLVIGHNPGLEDLAASLAERDLLLKTATMVVLRVHGTWRDLIPGRVSFERLIRARELGESA